MNALTRLYQHILYFFFLGARWNWPLAWLVSITDYAGEKALGIDTAGVDNLSDSLGEDDRKHASIYQPVNYYTADKLFSRLAAADFTGGFLDVGCGKGRMLAYAASKGFSEIFGVEIATKLCMEAMELADDIEDKYTGVQVEVTCQDAREYDIPVQVHLVFMFNPFDKIIMQGFVHKIKQSLEARPRPLKILYANPQCEDLLLEAGFVKTFSFKKYEYLEGAIYSRA